MRKLVMSAFVGLAALSLAPAALAQEAHECDCECAMMQREGHETSGADADHSRHSGAEAPAQAGDQRGADHASHGQADEAGCCDCEMMRRHGANEQEGEQQRQSQHGQ